MTPKQNLLLYRATINLNQRMVRSDFFTRVRGIPTTVTSKDERKRVETLNQMMLRGESPYAHITNGGVTGGDVPEGVKKVDLKARKINDEEKDRVWDREPSLYKANRTSKSLAARETAPLRDRPIEASEALSKILLMEDGPFTVETQTSGMITDKNRCYFCGDVVELMSATMGSGKVRKVGVTEFLEDEHGVLVPVEVIKHISAKVIACPDCSLKIGPLFNRCIMCKGLSKAEIASCKYCHGTKQGERSSGGQKWPIGD